MTSRNSGRRCGVLSRGGRCGATLPPSRTLLCRGNVVVAALVVASVVVAAGGENSPRKQSVAKTVPHIVLMIVDEMGTGDVPWADSTIHAPTIDRLASDGVRLGTM